MLALRASDLLMARLRAGRPLPSSDSLSVFDAFHFSMFFPLTGTYTALAQTGDLNLIRSDSLRARVASYTGELEGMSRQIEDWTASFHRNVEELIRVAPIGRIRFIASGRPDPAARRGYAGLERALYTQSLISDARISDLLELLRSTRVLRRDLEADLR